MSKMVARSGQVYDTDDLEIMTGFARHGVIERRTDAIKMRGGLWSRTYVQGRSDFTKNPKLLMAVGKKICRVTKEIIEGDPRTPCFIGLPTAGTALAAFASAADEAYNITGRGAIFYVMRETKKTGHGAQDGWVVGEPDHARHRYIRLDNVITDGGTKIDMDQRFSNDGFDVDDMDDIILIDREQGGMENLARHGFKRARAVWKLLDAVDIMGRLSLWPEENVAGTIAEIEGFHAHA